MHISLIVNFVETIILIKSFKASIILNYKQLKKKTFFL